MLPRDDKYSTYAWFNGNISKREQGAPSVASASFHLGTSVFDGLVAYWNRDHYYLHYAEAHLIRFREGAKQMGLALPWSIEEMLAGIKELLKREPAGTKYVRPIAYWRAPELWITGSEGRLADVSIFTVSIDTYRDVDTPIVCQLSPIERISSRSIPSQIKVSGAYVNSFFARRTAELAGYDDAIMFDREGRLAEASAANVFVILGDAVVTPPPNPDLFPGITRKVILELAHSKGIKAREMDLRCHDLANIDGAFLCSTLMEIRGLSGLDDRKLRTLELPVYRTLLEAFRTVTHQ